MTALSLAVEALEVRYPGLPVPALAIEALTLEAGARVALTGPSGSGKTTFINVIAGMERLGAGRVAWSGEDLAALSEGGRDRWRARNVGLVMQEFHLFAGLSAVENVLLPQRLSHFRLPDGARARGLSLLERVGIERPGQPVETMSRGQMQRVAVARRCSESPASSSPTSRRRASIPNPAKRWPISSSR